MKWLCDDVHCCQWSLLSASLSLLYLLLIKLHFLLAAWSCKNSFCQTQKIFNLIRRHVVNHKTVAISQKQAFEIREQLKRVFFLWDNWFILIFWLGKLYQIGTYRSKCQILFKKRVGWVTWTVSMKFKLWVRQSLIFSFDTCLFFLINILFMSIYEFLSLVKNLVLFV